MALDHVAILRREGDALLAAATDLDAAVPSCPGWDIADLVWHVGEVHAFWCAIVENRLADWRDAEARKPSRPARDRLLEFAREELVRLVDALAGADPAEEVWTWSHQRDVAFVRRRMAQETLVHRWDTEAATAQPRPLAAEDAADGVDEFLEHVARFRRDGAADLGGTAHLHATDTPGEWVVDQRGDELLVRREHAKGDTALRGPASELLLVLWRRVPLDRLEVLGDRSVAEALVGWPGTE